MTRTVGRLQIDNEKYSKKIIVPRAEHLLQLTTEQVDDILEMPIHQGDKCEKDNSIFVGFTAAVNDYEQIQKLYFKMKLLHPGARHIVCVFRIPGMKSFQCEDYCDNEETNCGQSLLRWMQEENLTCRVFFVARFYGGIKMGTERFRMYQDAAIKVLNKHPYNNVNQKMQAVAAHVQSDDRATELNQDGMYTEHIKDQKNPWRPAQRQRRTFTARKSLSQWRDEWGRGRPIRRTSNRGHRGGGRKKNPGDEKSHSNFNYRFNSPISALTEEEWPKLPKSSSYAGIRENNSF